MQVHVSRSLSEDSHLEPLPGYLLEPGLKTHLEAVRPWGLICRAWLWRIIILLLTLNIYTEVYKRNIFKFTVTRH